MQIDDQIIYDLMEWVAGNRGGRQGNPYCVPEVTAMLKAMAAQLEIRRDWLDANQILAARITASKGATCTQPKGK